VRDEHTTQLCPHCERPVYATDCLRIHESVTDFQPNGEALNRVMNVTEHLMLAHFIRMFVHHHAQNVLARTAFFVDGPLAVFGEMAWIHQPVLRYIHQVNHRLRDIGQPPLLVIGLQKSGQITDYARIMDRHLPLDRLLLVDDEFRYKWIAQREAAAVTFGLETHYGQDFIYKSPSGRTFVLAVPYPIGKTDRAAFVRDKRDITQYNSYLLRALKLVSELECDLYENATIPIVLAHRYTAISLIPGGKVLDILSKEGLARSRFESP
jgi:hypothetical protein